MDFKSKNLKIKVQEDDLTLFYGVFQDSNPLESIISIGFYIINQ